ncbi:HNH endonuclease [Streptomyces sp. NPDC056638]|uniref:HNH endonuclease n=1 Tax=Streptomyces sp. NPDC056638 TaxID=3345887 RepID=UPI0036ADEDD5
MASTTNRTLPAWVRTVVLSANGGFCTYCGSMGTKAEVLDHVDPLELGGAHSITNLVPACRSCNASKQDRPLLAWKRTIDRRMLEFEWEFDNVCPAEIMDRTPQGVLELVQEIQSEVLELARPYQGLAVEQLQRRIANIGTNVEHLTAEQRDEVLDAMRTLLEQYPSPMVTQAE